METVKPRETFTPSHMRRSNASRNGSVDAAKSQAFRSCKRTSDLYIHQPASVLEKIGKPYRDYCGVCDRDALRKGK